MKESGSVYGVWLPRETAKKARVVAAQLDTSRSTLMRDLLVEFLNKHDQQTGNGATAQHAITQGVNYDA